jgi:hypothetical protein
VATSEGRALHKEGASLCESGRPELRLKDNRRGKPGEVEMGEVVMIKNDYEKFSVMLGVLDSGPYSSHAECSW